MNSIDSANSIEKNTLKSNFSFDTWNAPGNEMRIRLLQRGGTNTAGEEQEQQQMTEYAEHGEVSDGEGFHGILQQRAPIGEGVAVG